MDNNFKPGDIVELKSGGPDMTISSIENGSVFCQWFDSKSEPQGRSYTLAVLKLSSSQ